MNIYQSMAIYFVIGTAIFYYNFFIKECKGKAETRRDLLLTKLRTHAHNNGLMFIAITLTIIIALPLIKIKKIIQFIIITCVDILIKLVGGKP